MKKLILSIIGLLVLMSTMAFARDIYATGQFMTNNQEMMYKGLDEQYSYPNVVYNQEITTGASYIPFSNEMYYANIGYNRGTVEYRYMSGRIWKVWSSTKNQVGDNENGWPYNGAQIFISTS